MPRGELTRLASRGDANDQRRRAVSRACGSRSRALGRAGRGGFSRWCCRCRWGRDLDGRWLQQRQCEWRREHRPGQGRARHGSRQPGLGCQQAQLHRRDGASHRGSLRRRAVWKQPQRKVRAQQQRPQQMTAPAARLRQAPQPTRTHSSHTPAALLQGGLAQRDVAALLRRIAAVYQRIRQRRPEERPAPPATLPRQGPRRAVPAQWPRRRRRPSSIEPPTGRLRGPARKPGSAAAGCRRQR